MHDNLNKRVASLGTYTPSGANTIAWDPGVPVEITRLIFVWTTANSGATNGITAQRRPIAGTAANQVTLGTFELPLAAAIAAGVVSYLDVGIDNAATDPGDGSVLEVARDHWTINPGQDFALVSDGDGTAGVCDVYVEYVSKPFAGTEIEDAIALTQLT